MPPPAVKTPVAVPDEGQIALARQRASTATTLDELRQHMAEFDGCNLKFTAKNWSSPTATRKPTSCWSARRPAATRTSRVLPFVGRSGQLLDRILAAIGLDRQSVYIANVIPVAAAWKPHADAAGDRDLPALHRAAGRARQSEDPGHARRSLGENAAQHDGRCDEAARQLESARHSLRHHDPDHADAASGLPAQKPGPQEVRVAGFPGDQGEAAQPAGIGGQVVATASRSPRNCRTPNAATTEARAQR